LVFLAVDKTRLQDLDEAARRYLAWESILKEKETLDLSPHQVKQAEMQQASADSTVAARIPEAYQWLLVPVQALPQAAVEWQTFRLSGQDALAVRASRKLCNDELLVTALAGTRLRMELDRVPLWRGDHVTLKQLIEDFASYLYLPRLQSPAVLLVAARDGIGLMLWVQESFAYADSLDEATGRYRGLRAGQHVSLSEDNRAGLLVRPEVARKQLAAEIPPVTTVITPPEPKPKPKPVPTTGPKRFHGTVTLGSTRVGADAGRIGEEVIAHLAGLVGAMVTVTLEIDAVIPEGAPEQVVRTVTENSRTLKFTSQGFEAE
jgi:hypothetical protein